MIEGLFKFAFAMYLKKAVESGLTSGVVEAADFIVVKGANDDEDGARAGFSCFYDLYGVEHEVFAKAWGGASVYFEKLGRFP